jgi:hypothetical protein
VQTNWHRETWVLRNAKATDVLSVLAKCESLTEQKTHITNPAIKSADFEVRTVTPAFFKTFFYTARKKWLDVQEISLSEGAEGVTAHAYSFSAGIAPLGTPGCLLPSLLLFMVPFNDFGQNKTHLRTLRGLLEDDGMEVEVQSAK